MSKKKPTNKEYADYVEHPRFGRLPHVTGLNPESDLLTGKVYIHWHSPPECRIAHTALAADVSRQAPATLHVTHYYDVKRECRDCGRRFIFSAREQKYWYEELGFPLEADCVRCIICRRKQQGLAGKRERYEELFHLAGRTPAQSLEMAECCLSLVEEGVFHRRQTQHVRRLLKEAAAGDKESQALQAALQERLKAIESGAKAR